ncbi:MAG: proline iminopeptidase [Bacteroidetes bacterium HGW-Bacteroidetes-16]|jgi:proline iminopeptidase|nr:MAG: proline iminopeptidase [Bacteroidetes bacterium HGW-Bacteroidetes-16]
MKNQILRSIGIIALVVIISSCSNKSNTTEQEKWQSYFENPDQTIQVGGVKVIPVKTPKGTFNVWTKQMGNNPTTKILLLNGGPGATHEYFECFENFLPKEGIEFIYYDQLACGHSDNPNDTSLYDLDRYVDEVEQVRQALHLDKNNFYLLGHSWGGILAMQYALKYQENLKGLIISNMMASCPEYGKYADEVLAKKMDPAVLDTIRMIEKNGDFDNPKYMELLETNYYSQHILRLPEEPEPMKRAFSKINSELYTMMQGPSEFGISGKLTHWDVSKELKNIHVPTLVIGATYDTMDPDYMEWMSKEIPGAQFLLCANGSHMCMFDDQQTYMNGLINYIQSVKNE